MLWLHIFESFGIRDSVRKLVRIGYGVHTPIKILFISLTILTEIYFFIITDWITNFVKVWEWNLIVGSYLLILNYNFINLPSGKSTSEIKLLE